MPTPNTKRAGQRSNAIPALENHPTKEGYSPMNVAVQSDEFKNINVMEHDGTLRVSSREVAENFGKAHRDVTRAIRSLECSDDFRARNFAQTPYVDAQNGQTYQMYEMTRDGFTFLVMGFTGKEAAAWKERYIAAFNAMEAQLRRPNIDVRDQSQLSQIAVQLIEVNKEQAKQIEDMREDVEAHERLAKADGSFNVTEAAKTLGLRRKDLFEWLSHNGWIYRRAGGKHRLGYQDKCNRGLLEHKTTVVYRADGSEAMSEQVRIPAKGLTHLAKVVPGVAHEVTE